MPAVSFPKTFVGALAALGALLFAGVAGAATCQPYWTTVSSPGYPGVQANLNSVSVRSDTDVWAAGRSGAGGFVQQWNGVSWTTRLGPLSNESFSGVATTPSDVWVVGVWNQPGTTGFKTRIRRWDGVSWSAVPSPNGPPAHENELNSAVALSATDVWAVGEWYSFDEDLSDSGALLEHWDGVSWSAYPAPDLSPGGHPTLYAVSASGPDDVWAVGGYTTDFATGYEGTLVLHWDGVDWTQVPSEDLFTDPDAVNFFLGGSTLPSGESWAVGGSGSGSTRQGVIEQWTGSDWSAVASPSVGSFSMLYGLAALGPSDAWAVGNSEGSGAAPTFGEHWDGSAWTLFPTANPSGNSEFLSAMAATPSGNLWAVGQKSGNVGTLAERLCPIKVRDSGYSLASATVPQGSPVAWSFPTYNATDHSVSDNSGMLYFNSGATSAGGSFTFTLESAGTYPIYDTGSANTSEIAVPVEAASAPGLHAKITWSNAAPEPGYVFDVQVRKPGSASFVNWAAQTGTTAKSATYTAATAGTYRFRARLRHPAASGSFSGWSPVKVFLIS